MDNSTINEIVKRIALKINQSEIRIVKKCEKVERFSLYAMIFFTNVLGIWH
jgi:hypothetical protein